MIEFKILPDYRQGGPLHGFAGSKAERTFIAVKPDGVQRGLVGEIIRRYSNPHSLLLLRHGDQIIQV